MMTTGYSTGTTNPVRPLILHAFDMLRRATMGTTELTIAASETLLLAAAARPSCSN